MKKFLQKLLQILFAGTGKPPVPVDISNEETKNIKEKVSVSVTAPEIKNIKIEIKENNMKLEVLRFSSGKDSTLGIFSDITEGRKFLCYTLEDEFRTVKK